MRSLAVAHLDLAVPAWPPGRYPPALLAAIAARV